MIPQNKTMLAAPKFSFCALILCFCLAAAGFAVARVQADGRPAALQTGNPASTTPNSGEEPEAIPSDRNRGEEEEEAPASAPAADEQHNSNGDDVVVRILR